MIHKPTFEQEMIYNEIIDIVKSPKCGRNLMLEADAGTGKSSTIQEATKLIPDKVLYLAYNTHIADDYRPKAQPNTEVRTTHSHGFKAILSTIKYGLGKEVTLDEYKVNDLVKTMLTQYLEVGEENTKLLRSVVPKLVSHLKSTLLPMTKESVEFLADKFQLEDYYILLENNNEKIYTNNNGLEYVIDSEFVTNMCTKIIQICFRVFLPNESCSIDYDDQFWLPIVRPDIRVKKYPWVIVDECLPYHIPILLADGTSKEIGEIVENKISTNVLAYDEINKIQKSCKIVGWHKIPNTKKLLKIKVRWSQKKGTNTKYTFTVCTEDHKIWTPIGYKEAQNIQIGDEVQVETSASITQKYKITSKGRDKVSQCITKRNRETQLPHYTPSKEEFMKIRKGNGHGITTPQKILTEFLGEGWINEFPVKTKEIGGRSSGFPTNYKIDIANPTKKIAIEVDGRSHESLKNKEKDMKKEFALQRLGWKVLRFKNEDILRNTDTIVNNIKNSDCPISAKVVSIEAIHTDEYYVYDIDVEECHNFYANGILVHNCQDLNPAQMKLVTMSVTPNGTIIVVGDPHQSIYAFRGADSQAMPKMKEQLKAKVFSLSVCFRCPTEHVKLAQRYVSSIKPFENNKSGVISHINDTIMYNSLISSLPNKDPVYVLCRNNYPLIKPCFELIRNNVNATIRGREIGKNLISRIRATKGTEIEEFKKNLKEWMNKKKQNLEENNKSVELLIDTYETIIALSSDCNNTDELIAKIDRIFSDKDSAIVFSTIHKVKGFESDKIYVLYPELMPSPYAKTNEQIEQERNIQYISVTRSKEYLIFVHELKEDRRNI